MDLSSQFVNLHTHSHFSLLDGLGKPTEYVKRATELGQPAIAVTDHGSLSGVYQLWKAANEAGIKPIAGCEFYLAPSELDRKEPVYWGAPDQRQCDISGQGAYLHITVLAKNAEGLRNLFRLQELAYRKGFYRKPRIDLASLRDYNSGLIVLTGCPGGPVSTLLRLGQYDTARDYVNTLKDHCESVYVELMHHGIKTEELDQEKLNADIVRIASEVDLPLVATNDAHYCHQMDSTTHQALLCVQTHSKLSNPTFSFSGSSYHIASADEMYSRFAEAGLPESAIAETANLAEQVEPYDEVFQHRSRMPRSNYDTTRHKSPESALKYIVLGTNVTSEFNDTYDKRVRYELDTICSLGFADYFLVVADIVNEAKVRNIRVGPARGSVGGSLVAYVLGIQSLDPIASGLLFERFLNPERVGLPDIDLDVQEDRRDEFLAIAREKYGSDCVAQLATFGTVGAKAALKDATRVLGHPYRTGEEHTWDLPKPKFGRAPTLADYTGPQDDIFELATGLEGTIRNESVHAAAAIIGPEPLHNEIPIRFPGGKGNPVAALDGDEIEELGYCKLDVLGLRNLKVINDCLTMLLSSNSYNKLPELPTAPSECNDPATFALLSRGDSTGVFQLDGSGMRGLLRQVAPDSFTDISAVLSLYRPGPMGVKADRDYAQRKHAKQRISYPHPELEEALAPILSETYGLIVYQEQVLQVLAAVGDYTYGSAELIFNAMRKKQVAKMQAAKPDFVTRMKNKGYSSEAIEALWETLVPFADYSFNKSHATGYGIIAYWTAYLKANHPIEYMTALLSNETENDTLHEYLSESRQMGINILPPDVNDSQHGFAPTAKGVRYGLAAIKGVGEKAVAAIVKERPYSSLSDFYFRVPSNVLNVGVITALCCSGALDSLIPSREGLASTVEQHCEKATTARAAKKKGQRGVVRPRFNVPRVECDNVQRRRWEHDALGVELSMGRLIIQPHDPLDPAELEWVKKTLESYPGHTPATLRMKYSSVDTGYMVELTQASKALAKLGKLDTKEE